MQGQRTGNETCPGCGSLLRDLDSCTCCGWPRGIATDTKLLNSIEPPSAPTAIPALAPAVAGPAPAPSATASAPDPYVAAAEFAAKLEQLRTGATNA
jgi:hypothetical protein